MIIIILGNRSLVEGAGRWLAILLQKRQKFEQNRESRIQDFDRIHFGSNCFSFSKSIQNIWRSAKESVECGVELGLRARPISGGALERRDDSFRNALTSSSFGEFVSQSGPPPQRARLLLNVLVSSRVKTNEYQIYHS